MFIQHNASGGEGLSVPTAPTIGNTNDINDVCNDTYDDNFDDNDVKNDQKKPNIKRFGKKFTNFSTIA